MTGPDSRGVDKVVPIIAAAVTAGMLATAGGYGIFRDELYYVACARHLDWGYVDHPPLIGALTWLVIHTLGTSVIALRALPALCAGVLTLLAAALAKRFGGGRSAQILAAVAVALAPINLSLLTILSMNAVDLVMWSAILLTVATILDRGDRRLWLAFGVLAGIGLMNKISVLFVGAGILAGLVVARRWEDLKSRHFWIGGVIAALIFAPHVIWQAMNDWPTVEFIRGATENKNVAFTPIAFLREQVLFLNPVTLPLWAAGLYVLLFTQAFRPFRALGIAWLAVLAIMLTQNAKPYYLAPSFPMLLAAGAVAFERATSSRLLRQARPAALVLLVVTGVVLAPLAKPLMSEDRFVAYADALGVAQSADEQHELGRLPQFFADMHGWQAMAETVAAVYSTLPQEDQRQACVYGQNYGEAGAIDYFGPALGLPPAVSGHNSYWLWGPGACSGNVLIVIGGDREDHLQAFETVDEGGRFDCVDCMPYENHLTLWIARRLRAPLSDIWPQTKHFD